MMFAAVYAAPCACAESKTISGRVLLTIALSSACSSAGTLNFVQRQPKIVHECVHPPAVLRLHLFPYLLCVNLSSFSPVSANSSFAPLDVVSFRASRGSLSFVALLLSARFGEVV